jgi:hypothetical protein
VPPFPSSDRWVPLPATGSGPPVLRRHWTPAAPTPSAPRRDYWTPAQPDDSAVPVLERHWACGTTFPPQTTPVHADSHRQETVTPAAKTTAPLAHRLTLPDRTPTAVPATVTPASLHTLRQTVTRLCVGCGKPLEGKRPQAKAHGVACRQRAYRRRKKQAGQAQGQRENGRGSEPELAALARVTLG